MKTIYDRILGLKSELEECVRNGATEHVSGYISMMQEKLESCHLLSRIFFYNSYRKAKQVVEEVKEKYAHYL